ncbi:hypothetical protein D3C85_1095920 [compost metagenome]
MRPSFVISSPTSLSPKIKLHTPSETAFALKTCAIMCWQAIAVKGVFSDGFQMHTLPQTSASAAFQLQTATGKLNAEIMPTIPSGCHCSYMRWLGRSLCMVKPYSWRDKPTAKSQISIISCTSPSPSCKLFPISYETSVPKSDLFSRRASPNCRTISPLFGAGMLRHSVNAVCAWRTTVS